MESLSVEAPLDVGQGGIGCDQGLCQDYPEEYILQLTELEDLHLTGRWEVQGSRL